MRGPQGDEVVASWREVPADGPRAPLLVLDTLTAYLRSLGFAGDELEWQRIGDGQSNVTFALRFGAEELVLRRGPRPPIQPSTHDMAREARVQRALGAAGVPVPRIIATCDDSAVLGVPFYLMNRIDGVVVTDTVPVDLAEAIHEVPVATIDALAQLHAVDITAADIAALGRPEGYLQRQLTRFAALWPEGRHFDDFETLHALLGSDVPLSQRHSVVHGDFRIGNVMFAPRPPVQVAAILDWEMATLGDPLADLGYFVATYSSRGRPQTVLDLTPVTAEAGFATRDDLVARYAEHTGLDVSRLPWYEALALFKGAVFCEAIYQRYIAGERQGDTFGPRLETGVPAMLAAGLAALERA